MTIREYNEVGPWNLIGYACFRAALAFLLSFGIASGILFAVRIFKKTGSGAQSTLAGSPRGTLPAPPWTTGPTGSDAP